MRNRSQNISGDIRTATSKSPEEIAELKEKLRETYSEEFPGGQHVPIKRKKVRCITRAMAEDFSREQVLLSSLVETMFYIIFVFCCCVFVTNLKSTEMFYMVEAIKQGLVGDEFKDSTAEIDLEGIMYDDINSVTDIWVYIYEVFLPNVYHDKYFDKYVEDVPKHHLMIMHENILLGAPRIRQVRVKENSCIVHPYFQRLFKKCYAAFEKRTEDKSAFGPKNGTAWIFTDASVTGNRRIEGTVATYTGGGFYLDLSLNDTEARAQVDELKDNLWITRGTRAIFISFTVYNVNLNIFGVCHLVFELPPTGGVLPKYRFDAVKLISSRNKWEYLTFFCEIVFYIFIFGYFLQALREMIYFKARYFIRFWSYVDCIITVLAFTTLVLNHIKGRHVEKSIQNIKEKHREYGNLEYISHLENVHDDTCAICLYFVFIRFFKYLNFNKTMGQLNDTLKKCALDVVGFSIMFFIIFFAYAELGFLLFGSQVEDFKTFGHSMFTLLRTILGDFDYEKIEKAHRYLAPAFFLSYIFLVFFVLLNMFLAIINDTYADVKTELTIAPNELQMTDYIKLNAFKLIGKLKCFKGRKWQTKKEDFILTADEIRTALEKCGFSYLEIEMFFARYNINPLAVVSVYDINKLIGQLESITPDKQEGEQTTEENTKLMGELETQQQQLKEMEAIIFELAKKIDTLIQKLQVLGKSPESSGIW